MRNSVANHHEDHIAGKGENSFQHYNLVHKFIPMQKVMIISCSKSSGGQGMRKIGEIFDVEPDESRKQEVIHEARTAFATVHFASLMDTCHLKHAELEAKHQKNKGRVVLRGDIVNDDSGSYAVFTEKRSSACQMTAVKIMDIISRLPGLRWTSSRRSIGLHPSENGKMLTNY